MSTFYAEWLPELSGCYRPHYFNRQQSRGTENQKVSLLEPAVAMISDPNIISTDLGYQPGEWSVSLHLKALSVQN